MATAATVFLHIPLPSTLATMKSPMFLTPHRAHAAHFPFVLSARLIRHVALNAKSVWHAGFVAVASGFDASLTCI